MPNDPFITPADLILNPFSCYVLGPSPRECLWFPFCSLQVLKSLIPSAKFSHPSHSPVLIIHPPRSLRCQVGGCNTGPLRSDPFHQGSGGPGVYFPHVFFPAFQPHESRNCLPLDHISWQTSFWGESIIQWRVKPRRCWFESLLCFLSAVSWASYFYLIESQISFWKMSKTPYFIEQ